MNRLMKTAILPLLALASLSACGNTPTDRALSGAALGAGAGLALGGLAGGSGLTGAAIGAAAGAVGGAVTDKSDINLGKPIWR